MAKLPWNMLGAAPGHGFIHSPSSGRNLASCGVDCCACAGKKKSGHKNFAGNEGLGLIMVWALWYTTYRNYE